MKKKRYNELVKKTERNHSFLSYYLMRPVSRFLVYYLSMTGIKPEQVVLISIFVSLVGAALVFTQNYYLIIVGFLVLFFRNILDCVDGDLARFKGLVSKKGALFDEFADRLNDLFVVIAIGYVLFNHTGVYGLILAAVYMYVYLTAVNISLKLEALSYISKPDKQKSFLRRAIQYGGENNLVIFIFFALIDQLLWGVVFATILTGILVVGRFVFSYYQFKKAEKSS